MTFEEALAALREKKTVRRHSVGHNITVLLVQDGKKGKEKMTRPASMGELAYVIPVAFDWDDLTATDWEVVDD